MKHYIIIITLIVFTTFSAFGQYSKELEKDAQKGDPVAQANLGACYYYGNGVRQDISEAKIWLWRAAIRDLAPAQNLLANICFDEQDYEQAAEWYKKAANLNLPEAQLSLGACYENGFGVNRDIDEAIIWYKKAAKQNIPQAQFVLGLWYRDGWGANFAKNKNIHEAIYWLRKAAEHDIAEVQNALGICYIKIEPKDYEQAIFWFQKAAESGYAKAQYNLGGMFSRGSGVNQDYQQAVYWLKKAADQNIIEAKYELGRCYYNHNDFMNALNLFSTVYDECKKREEDNLKKCASQIIGIMHYNGEGVPQNIKKAFLYLKYGIEDGAITLSDDFGGQALHLLSTCYRFGYGTEKDIEKSDHLLQLAAHDGNSNAKMVLRLLE